MALLVRAPAPAGAWALAQLIQAALPGDQFGASCAMTGDAATLAVGATYGGGGEGAVHIFRRAAAGGGAWALAQVLAPQPAGGVRGLGVASALAADGSVLVAGAAAGPAAGGAVLVFAGAPGGGSSLSWAQTLSAADSAADDGFGSALALDAAAKTLIVGAAGRSAAYVFVRGAGGAFAQTQALMLAPGAMLGWSVSLAAHGGVAVVGANNARSLSSAPVALLRDAATGNWSVVQALAPSGGALPDGAYFGFSASLSATGALLAIGAEGAGSARAGAVYLFQADA